MLMTKKMKHDGDDDDDEDPWMVMKIMMIRRVPKRCVFVAFQSDGDEPGVHPKPRLHNASSFSGTCRTCVVVEENLGPKCEVALRW